MRSGRLPSQSYLPRGPGTIDSAAGRDSPDLGFGPPVLTADATKCILQNLFRPQVVGWMGRVAPWGSNRFERRRFAAGFGRWHCTLLPTRRQNVIEIGTDVTARCTTSELRCSSATIRMEKTQPAMFRTLPQYPCIPFSRTLPVCGIHVVLLFRP